MHDIVHDREYRAGSVDTKSHPPEQLFVEALLEIFQDEKTDRQTGQRAGQMCHVRDWRSQSWWQLLGFVPVVDRETNVGARWNRGKKKNC